MYTENILSGKDLNKKYKGFNLSIPELNIPKGFATALIGENGAGKTTLLNMMAGIRLDYTGEFKYFENLTIDDKGVKERIGYTGPNNYFLSHWTIKQVEEISGLLFDDFDKEKFNKITEALSIPVNNAKNIKSLSDGNRMKLMLACVLARNTEFLILDEPASPLDPLMRDRLCEIIREYIANGNGEKSVFFSTHNIADMENCTDYAIIMEKGTIIEEGFVEDLKEKYVIVRGDIDDYEKAKGALIGISKSTMGFEGLCSSDNLEALSGLDIATEIPSLSQISVGLMKEHTTLAGLF